MKCRQIKTQTWADLNFPDYRARFFIESWCELLYRRTPHFHQARLMNFVSFIAELSDCTESFDKFPLKFRHFRESASEFCEYLKTDHVAEKIYGDDLKYFIQKLRLFSRRTRANEISRQELTALTLMLRRFSVSLPDYLAALAGRLLEQLTKPTDLKKKDRVLTEIYDVASAFISCLLSVGYSSTFLYNRADILTYKSRYKGRDFGEQIRLFIDRLMKGDAKYQVIVTGHISRKKLRSVGEIAAVSVSENKPSIVSEEDAKAILKSHDSVYMVGEATAKDYIAAVWEFQRELEVIRDWTVYNFKEDAITFSNAALVRLTSEEDKEHKHVVRYETLASLMHGRPSPEGLLAINAIDSISKRGKVFESLSRLLRYYRTGLLEATFESKFLSMWIALESSVDGDESEAIKRITSTVPTLYAHDSLRKRLAYIRYLLTAQSIPISRRAQKHLQFSERSFSRKISLENMFELISSKPLAEEIFESITVGEWLKYRIVSAHQAFCSKESIQERINKTTEDVERQLHRIYYLRNKIVHQAMHGRMQPRLYAHLCDYVETVLERILEFGDSCPEEYGLYELMVALDLAIQTKTEKWKSQKEISAMDVVHLDPFL